MPASPRSASSQQNHDPVPPLGGALDFMRILWAVDHGLHSASKRMEMHHGVTALQRFTIRILGRFPAASAGRIAEILHVHPSTLTGVLRRLESRGYIQRQSDPNDARRALFVLTPKGRSLNTLQSGTVEAAVRKALSGISERKLAAAREVLSAVARELGV